MTGVILHSSVIFLGHGEKKFEPITMAYMKNTESVVHGPLAMLSQSTKKDVACP